MAKRISVSAAKGKGRKFQQDIAKYIAIVTGQPYGKDEDIESRGGGQHGVDIILRGEAKRLFPFAVECKRQESWSVHNWIEQAQTNIGNFKTWLLFARRSNEKPVVIMDADFFFELYKEFLELDKDSDLHYGGKPSTDIF